ncbi:M48 family metallopeptidase [Fulvivirgaceae bacterium LMO-SS25]
MSKYVGIQGQIRSNNRKSILLLLAFPTLVLVAVYAFIYFTSFDETTGGINSQMVKEDFIASIPATLIIVGIWFSIAYFFNVKMIQSATGAKPLERKENMRIYNLTENLCISRGMKMPKINVIPDPSLNAFASGINEKSYTVTLTQGIIDKLDDQELEGVIAHELMHIRNNDVKLLIISIVFVGIFSLVAQMLFRMLIYGGGRRRGKDNKGGGALIIALVIAAIAYFLSLIFKFAISRSREYMADSGAAEMTRNPRALASALRKISGNSEVGTLKSEDVSALFIDNSSKNKKGFASMISGIFATHPPIEKRIKLLEEF